MTMRKTKKIVKYVFAVLLLAGLAKAAAFTFIVPSYDQHFRNLWIAEIDAVSVDNGIDAGEAASLMQIYTNALITGCFGLDQQPTLVNGSWVSGVAFGPGGFNAGDWVRVDAVTGAISSNKGPTLHRLLLLRTAIILTYNWRRQPWQFPWDAGVIEVHEATGPGAGAVLARTGGGPSSRGL